MRSASGGSEGARRPAAAIVLASAGLLAVGALGGCKVMTGEEVAALRQRGTGAFDAGDYVSRNWNTRVLPVLRTDAVTLPALARATRGDPAALERIGRRAGEGSPLTLVVRGRGVVLAVDRSGPKGRAALETGTVPVSLQLGPLVSGTAVRDAVPFVRFDDVPDQVAFARLGSALTERALAPIRPKLARLAPGDRIRFLGVGPWRGDGGPLLVTPVALAVER